MARAIERASRAAEDEELRDAVIQRFEYSYELCWKMLKRHLEQVVPNAASIDQLSFRELIREGAERGIVGEFEPWLEYRHQRNSSESSSSAMAIDLLPKHLRIIEGILRTSVVLRSRTRDLAGELA